MSMPQFETVLIEQLGAHCNIWLNRAEKRNALNNQLINDLKEAMIWAGKQSTVRVISLKGKGKAFCSGADISQMQSLKTKSLTENRADSLKLAELFSLIYNHQKPIVAVVEGPALAGGCGLASACDFIIATQDSKFGYPEVKIGFVAAMVMPFLIRAVGEKRARFILLTGNIFSAREMLEYGLVNIVTSVSDIVQEENKLVKSLLANSPQAMAQTKTILNMFDFSNYSSVYDLLSQKNAEARQMDDFKEGIDSFLEKRKPNWKIQQ